MNAAERPFDTLESAEACMRFYLTEVFPKLRELEEQGAHITTEGLNKFVEQSQVYFRHAVRKDRADLKRRMQ